jgi:hypothetical protein
MHSTVEWSGVDWSSLFHWEFRGYYSNHSNAPPVSVTSSYLQVMLSHTPDVDYICDDIINIYLGQRFNSCDGSPG